ncbi:unnamed protein product [Spodoptera littoralis]|uniref:L-lactate dehydrogenase n=1 Tax=Spodoptera littoralis TaxID=7109 RepID=A0A9P0IKM1_SPOLI|nr:unnamed protein product [Spodoptera littoralis]CAH1647844.1 unnamed protein product [Spodoptera littoralis]
MFPLLKPSSVPQLASRVRKQISAYDIFHFSLRCASTRNPPPPEPAGSGVPCKQFTTIGKVFKANSHKSLGYGEKISIVGLDDIGTAIVYTLLAKGITNNICMIDMNEEILEGEHLDLQSGAMFLNNPKIISSKDPADTRDSKICIITTGTYKGRDEEDSEYIARNAGIVRAIVAPLAKYNPNAIFVVASEPVDILSYVAWKLIGMPKNRIIGTGTLMDTARFRFLLGDKFGVTPESCHGYIIGQHGQYSVPVWSSVNIGGVLLKDLNPQIGTDKDPECWYELYEDAVKAEGLVRQLKGCVSWSLALGVADICKCIFNNANKVLPVSTYVKGEHAIKDEVFLSLPCVVGWNGVSDIIRQNLSEDEAVVLRRGAENTADLQTAVNKIIS